MSNVGVIEKLTYFEHKDANAKDWGLNVRQRAKELVALINDPERMRRERHKVGRLTRALPAPSPADKSMGDSTWLSTYRRHAAHDTGSGCSWWSPCLKWP